MLTDTKTKKIRIERTKDNRKHITYISDKVSCHCELINKVVDRALQVGVRIELVESLFDCQYETII